MSHDESKMELTVAAMADTIPAGLQHVGEATNPGLQEQQVRHVRRWPKLSLYRALMVMGMAAGVALPLQPAAAKGGASTQVFDPVVLRSMGFPRNATNVYMDDVVGLETAAAADDDVAMEVTPTSGVDYSAISAKEFTGRIDSTGTQWAYAGGPTCCVDLSRTGTEQFADAQFEVPTGATLTFFRYWAYDNSASNLAFFVFEVCQPGFAGGAPVINTIVSTSTSGTPGHTSNVVTLARPVNNQDCTYLARVRFDAATTSLALQKVRLQFNR